MKATQHYNLIILSKVSNMLKIMNVGDFVKTNNLYHTFIPLIYYFHSFKQKPQEIREIVLIVVLYVLRSIDAHRSKS